MEENTEQKGNMTPLFIGVAVLVVLAGGFFLFKSNNTSNQMTEDTTTEKSVVEEESVVEETSDEAMMEDEETIMDEDVVEVDVEGGSFYFEPSELIVKKGQTVRVNFTAVDAMHDFNLDEFNVDGTVVKEGESTTVEFVADQAGDFEYYCSVGQHRANGMVGTLTVEE